MSFLLFVSMLIIAFSICFTRLQHPLAMGSALMLQTLMICVAAGLYNKSMWFSYMLFLIFLGAVLVLFIYVASLASNESFRLSPWLILIIGVLALLGVSAGLLDPLVPALKIAPEASYLSLESAFLMPQASLSFLYNPSSMTLTLYIILYLLLTLIVVVKITTNFLGPLRPS